MLNEADMVGLNEEQARRFDAFDREISQSREGIAAWQRLLDRRRLDRKLGLHPIAEFAVKNRPEGDEQGSLEKREPEERQGAESREPFYLRTEAEARGLLLRCLGYLSDADGTKLATDKGYGGRDKMAEWLAHEIKQSGGLAFVSKRSPYVFGIPLAVAQA